MIMFVTKADVKKVNGMNGVACEMSTSDEERYSHVVKFQLTGKGMNFMYLTFFFLHTVLCTFLMVLTRRKC